jgi:hypothetical protein
MQQPMRARGNEYGLVAREKARRIGVGTIRRSVHSLVSVFLGMRDSV